MTGEENSFRCEFLWAFVAALSEELAVTGDDSGLALTLEGIGNVYRQQGDFFAILITGLGCG